MGNTNPPEVVKTLAQIILQTLKMGAELAKAVKDAAKKG